MKINAILHKVGAEEINDLKLKLVEALKDNPDIIIGPDAALRYDKDLVLSPRNYRNALYDDFMQLSKDSGTIILPGTITYPINNKEIVCEAPLFNYGALIKTLWKERDNGECNLAKEKGYIYKKGDNSKNSFNFKGRKIALEICGDHGNQNVRGCDLELILAYDSKAGFWLNALNDNFSRKAIVCDGYAPKIEAFDYDVNRSIKNEIINPRISSSGDIYTFEF